MSIKNDIQLKNSNLWCKYCEKYVVNNKPSIRDHENSIRHKVNVKKYEQKKKEENIEQEIKNNELESNLLIINKNAQDQYIKNDILKQNDKTLLNDYLNKQNEFDIAKKLYGENFFNEKIINQNKIEDKNETYNKIMKSLPTHIQKKYRQII